MIHTSRDYDLNFELPTADGNVINFRVISEIAGVEISEYDTGVFYTEWDEYPDIDILEVAVYTADGEKVLKANPDSYWFGDEFKNVEKVSESEMKLVSEWVTAHVEPYMTEDKAYEIGEMAVRSV